MFWCSLPPDLCLIWLMQILISFLNYPHLCVYTFSPIIYSSHTFYTSIFFHSLHTSHLSSQVESVVFVKALFLHIVPSYGLINIKLCRNQQNCHFYDILYQPEDISRQFGVQLYLSSTIGAFHASAVDDKKISQARCFICGIKVYLGSSFRVDQFNSIWWSVLFL